MTKFSLNDDQINEDILISPVTTPTSTVDEERCLVHIVTQPTKLNNRDIWNYWLAHAPLLIIFFSFAEIIFFIETDNETRKILRFEPNKRHQVWRYVTYMLVHEDFVHLILNIVLQCIFAFFLESKQGRCRVGIIYLAGGVTGVLGASCLNPGLLIGASAGVYSLLISLVADLYLNYENMKNKAYRMLCITVILLSDIAFNLYHYLSRDEPLISWEAHVFGGLTGLILGLALYINSEGLQQQRKTICLTFNSLLYFLLFTSLVIITIDTDTAVQTIKA